MTAGAITNRVTRLESNGWVRRDVDPADRRQVLVTLTKAGQQRADEIMAIRTTTEERLLGRAGPDAIRQMCEDLRDLLLAIEGPRPTSTLTRHATRSSPGRPRRRVGSLVHSVRAGWRHR